MNRVGGGKDFDAVAGWTGAGAIVGERPASRGEGAAMGTEPRFFPLVLGSFFVVGEDLLQAHGVCQEDRRHPSYELERLGPSECVHIETACGTGPVGFAARPARCKGQGNSPACTTSPVRAAQLSVTWVSAA